MPSNSSEDSLLLIRCPSCGQRFKVGDDLRERTVECGGCEHRFRISDDTIVRGRKFYPSAGKKDEMSRFQRVPKASVS
ncbi:MAG: MJ0042-type zinc finger domain-containing protein, partial [Luteolibacter sp.]